MDKFAKRIAFTKKFHNLSKDPIFRPQTKRITPIVWTSSSSGYEEMTISWYASLRELGKYKGLIVILDAGMDKRFAEKFSKLENVKVIPIQRKYNTTVIDRYIALKEVDVFKGSLPVHWDSDVWFQDDINGIFQLASNNICHTIDVHWYRMHNMLKNKRSGESDRKGAEKIYTIVSKYNGTIQGGFLAGPYGLLIPRLMIFEKLITDKVVKAEYGMDQFAFNYLYDWDSDVILSKAWNGIGADLIIPDVGSVNFLIKTKISGEVCKAVHVVGMLRGDRNLSFRLRYPEIFGLYNGIFQNG